MISPLYIDHAELLFPPTNTVALYGLPFQDDDGLQNAFALLYIYSQSEADIYIFF